MKLAIAHDATVTLAVPGVHRVELDGTTVGFVLEAEAVFVSLKGDVYNTACEVGQSLDLDTAIQRLLDL